MFIYLRLGHLIVKGAPMNHFLTVDLNFELSFIALIMVLLYSVLCLSIMIILGKRTRVFKTIEFKPIPTLSISQVAYILDGSISSQEIVSLIIEWAYKAYLEITYSTDHLGIFTLRKLKDIDSKEFEPDRTFFNSLFAKSNTISSKEIQLDFYDEIERIKYAILNHYKTHKEERIFIVDSWGKRLLTLVVMIPFVFFTFAQLYELEPNLDINIEIVFLEYLVGTSLVLWWSQIIKNRYGSSQENRIVNVAFCTSVGIMFYFVVTVYLFTSSPNNGLLVLGKTAFAVLLTCISSVMISLLDHRSKLGAVYLGKILGLREFIETAEKDRINDLTIEDPHYFYNLLPYATVFGLSDVWSNKFEFTPKVREASDSLNTFPVFDPQMIKDLDVLVSLGHVVKHNYTTTNTLTQLSKPDGHYDTLKPIQKIPGAHLGGIQAKGSFKGFFETLGFFTSLFSGGGFGGGGGHHW